MASGTPCGTLRAGTATTLRPPGATGGLIGKYPRFVFRLCTPKERTGIEEHGWFIVGRLRSFCAL